MAESLHCSPETTITLLIGYTPKQNKNVKVWSSQSGRKHAGEQHSRRQTAGAPGNLPRAEEGAEGRWNGMRSDT